MINAVILSSHIDKCSLILFVSNDEHILSAIWASNVGTLVRSKAYKSVKSLVDIIDQLISY